MVWGGGNRNSKRIPRSPRVTSRRDFLKAAAITVGATAAGAAGLASSQEPAFASGGINPPSPPQPGAPSSWQASHAIRFGNVNLSTGNVQLQFGVTGWSGRTGLGFGLVFNSQSTRTTAVGPKWTHSYNWYIISGNPAVVIRPDGTETAFYGSGSSFTAPVGCYDTLVQNADSTWTLTAKDQTLYKFNTSGQLVSIVDTFGNTVTVAWSGGVITSITDSVSRAFTLGYTSGKLTSVTDCVSNQWTLAYDSSGRLASITWPLLGGTAYDYSFGYDANNNVNSITDRKTNPWTYSYFNTNCLASVSGPSGSGESVFYALISGSSTPIRYGASPPPWPKAAKTTIVWTDPNLNTVTYAFDSNGFLVAMRDGLGDQSAFLYDANNNRNSVQLPSGKTTTSVWDSHGNKLSQKDPLGNEDQWTWNGAGQMLTHTDANLNETQYGYNANYGLTSVTRPDLGLIQYTLNSTGERTQITDQMLRVTTFGIDTYGHTTSRTNGLLKTTYWVYSKNSLLTQRTGADSRVTNYTQDAWGRLIGIAFPTSGAPSIALTLDAEGNLTEAVDGTGTRYFTVNAWGNRTQQTDPRGTTTAVYDAGQRLTSQTDVTGRITNYTYDAANNTVKVADSTSSASTTYNVDGLKTVVVTSDGVTKTNGYDGANRLTSVVHTNTSTKATIAGYTVTLDAGGRRTKVVEQPSGDITEYVWDSCNRLTSETRTGVRPYSGGYTYDASDLRLTAKIIINGTTVHNGAYDYNAAALLATCDDSATGLNETYTWNSDETLASWPGGSSALSADYDEDGHLLSLAVGGTTAYEYGYAFDGGRRWKKDISAAAWTWFPCGVACSAGDLVEQTSDLTGQSWSTSAVYLRGMGCGSSIYRRNSEWHLFDAGGTAGVITDGSANVLSNNLYDAFGVLMYTSGSAATQWRFLGRFVEEEGLVASAGGGGDMLVARGAGIGGRHRDCRGLSPGACYECEMARMAGKVDPTLACLVANLHCGSHADCNPPPPGGLPMDKLKCMAACAAFCTLLFPVGPPSGWATCFKDCIRLDCEITDAG
ncbi:MAG: RHS repeat protein [Armatimonadetes bacterium]|nr:RHS repeat protein [Armatimonadota bacterium]MDE2205249.1 RHS repeat protein [Armatimonadota bacterium]